MFVVDFGLSRRVGLDTAEGRERIAWIAKNAPGLLEGIKARGYVFIEDPAPVLEAAEWRAAINNPNLAR